MSNLAYHVGHFKSGSVGAIGHHNWEKRGEKDTHSNQDIDPSRSHLNVQLLTPDTSLYVAAKNRVQDATGRVTKASNWLTETIVYPPDDALDRYQATGNRAELQRYFQDVLAWHQEEFGQANVIASTAHFDETTPHLHTDIVPMTADGRLSAKDLFARKNLNRHHTELAAYLQKRGWDIQRGSSTKGKGVKAKTLKQYKKWADATQEEMSKKIDSLDQQLTAAQVEAREVKAQVSELKAELDELRQERDALASDLVDARVETAAARQETAAARQEAAALQAENVAMVQRLQEQHNDIMENQLVLAGQQEQIDAATAWLEEIPDWPTYTKVADEAVGLLDAFRRLLEQLFHSTLLFRNRKGERGVLEALEATTVALRQKLSMLLGYEAREFVEETQQRSQHITRELDRMLSSAEERSGLNQRSLPWKQNGKDISLD